jgi:hypothetical protein
MAFQADEGLGPGRKIFDLDEGFVIARGLLSLLRVHGDFLRGNPFNGETPGPVARFAVNQRHTGLARKLGPHGTCLKITPYLVMKMTGRKTGRRTHIVRVKPSRNHLFVFENGNDGLGSLEGLASRET